MMTKCDFQVIANVLLDSRPQSPTGEHAEYWIYLVERMAQILYERSAHYSVNGNIIHSFDARKFGDWLDLHLVSQHIGAISYKPYGTSDWYMVNYND